MDAQGDFKLEAAIQSVHAERARSGLIEWRAIVQFYAQLIRITPTIGRQTGYAAALAEANGPEQGLAALDALDRDTVSSYQPYWAVRAHLLQRLGRTREASEAYDRAIGLAEDPTIKEFLLRRRG
jgi:RNA polymerase sigma-70 factor (ECF subfamily)